MDYISKKVIEALVRASFWHRAFLIPEVEELRRLWTMEIEAFFSFYHFSNCEDGFIWISTRVNGPRGFSRFPGLQGDLLSPISL